MDPSLVRSAGWSVQAPASGSRDAVTIDFPETMDHALLHRMLVVRDGQARAVEGAVTVSMEERRWTFVPAERWTATRYTIEVDTELEDLAGNNLRRLFDVAPGDTAATGVSATKVSLPFTPR